MKPRSELLVSDLCEEIDILREEVAYWKGKYEREKTAYDTSLNERLEESKQGLADALLFAFSVREGEDGSLVIPAENRAALAEAHK